MSIKLNDALQQSYIKGMQVSLAEMNEGDYCLKTTDSSRKIRYGTTFFLFRGRIFASQEDWEKWLVRSASTQLHVIDLKKDASLYGRLWDQYKKIDKNLTNLEG